MKQIFALLLLLCVQTVFAQYRFDNAAFKTVYWSDLCETLAQNPDRLILDVRSKGEYEDTSASKYLNLGRLKEARHMDIREIGNRLSEIETYKDKPVFVYCSHSQRSRRVSKMLTDSGFTKVFNINGGISNLRLYAIPDECNLITASVPYRFVSPKGFAQAKAGDYFIVDVRADSLYRNVSTNERRNAFGRFKNSVNIPLSALEGNASQIPKGKKVPLVEESAEESAAAADRLHKAGFTQLFVLAGGFDGYLTEVPQESRNGWENPVSYRQINAATAYALAQKDNAIFVDVRPAEQFTNSSKDTLRNIGTIKNAVNLPFTEMDTQTALPLPDKEKPLVVYSMSSTPEAFAAAKKLSAQGYKNVNVLLGGLFNLRWRAANVKGMQYLNELVVNVPPDNR